jgi:hypothetical protein
MEERTAVVRDVCAPRAYFTGVMYDDGGGTHN